jgi:hypothetical protein
MMQWRHMVSVAAVAAALTACGSSPHVDEAASPFCVKARSVTTLDVAVQNVDESDPVAAQKAWDAYLSKAKDLAGSSPKALQSDYNAYVGWISDFQQALARHEYKFADAIDDQQFMGAMANDKTAESRQNVTNYIDSHCRQAPVASGKIVAPTTTGK